MNELNFMYQRLHDYIKEEYKQLLSYYQNLEELYNNRYGIISYPDCKSMIDVAHFKLASNPAFQSLSEDCQTYYFDYEEYAVHDTDNFPIEIGEYISIEERIPIAYLQWQLMLLD